MTVSKELFRKMASQEKPLHVVFSESDRFDFPNERPVDAVLRANTRGVESLAFLQHAEEPPSSHAATLCKQTLFNGPPPLLFTREGPTPKASQILQLFAALAIQHAASGVRDFESLFVSSFPRTDQARTVEISLWLSAGKRL